MVKRRTACLMALLLLLTLLSGCKKTATAEFDGKSYQYESGDHLKILDYNLCSADGGDGNTVPDRSLRFEELVEQYTPDLIGLQEASPDWIALLEEKLPDAYEMRYTYRAKSSREANPILWKKDRFELLDEGHFWLSDTPEIASKGWGSKDYRICSWVKLKVRESGKEFLFFNTQLTGEDNCAINSGNLIIQRARALGGFTDCAVFLTGDLDFAPWSAPYNNMVSVFSDFNDALGFDETAADGGDAEREEDGVKDYAMYSPGLVVPIEYKVVSEKAQDGDVSDHLGVYAEAALL